MAGLFHEGVTRGGGEGEKNPQTRTRTSDKGVDGSPVRRSWSTAVSEGGSPAKDFSLYVGEKVRG